MSFLPSELILCVLENGYYTPWWDNPTGTPNYKLLKACALVCRTWSGPAQSLIFRSVINIHAYNIHQFLAALLSSAARGRALGDCVRMLEISMSAGRRIGCSEDDFVNLLLACPQVYLLQLNVSGKLELEEKTLKKLKVAGRRLKALKLFFWERQPPISPYLFWMWPNIEFLHIGSDGPLVLVDARELAQRKGVELCLYELQLTRYAPPEAIACLLASSANSLRILDLEWHLTERDIDIIAPHAPHLRSLRISCGDSHPAPLKLLRMCTALEELVSWVFKSLSRQLVLYGMPERSPLAPHLAPTIECFKLSFTNSSRQGFSLKLQAVMGVVDALPNLRVVTCKKYPQQELVGYASDLQVFKAKCRVKGVEVVISELPSWCEDPVKTHRRKPGKLLTAVKVV
ncbi:hypothetical protein K503DRAFT_803469 [Rhizopogon vinicolor AM-OR11-026]|uniref:F-box domain-containing protein n=1 Tax=Rhizopogon vinicolor AM-OR11-026 TaxID=1314800 RepID=A0A1B7MPQ3_9AGAM|nr:hypothetical protein K503DRAFT_803469 [Rhizopogon vinicolor AM-OR11-026]